MANTKKVQAKSLKEKPTQEKMPMVTYILPTVEPEDERPNTPYKEQMQAIVLPSERSTLPGGREVYHTPGEMDIQKYPLASRLNDNSSYAIRKMSNQWGAGLPQADESRRQEVRNGRAYRVTRDVRNAAAAGASAWELQNMISEAWSEGLISAELEALLSSEYGMENKNYL